MLQGMIQLDQAKTRAKDANRVALDAGKRILLNKKLKDCNRLEHGFPGHGKGSWDGLGVMTKTKVTRDLTTMVKHLLATYSSQHLCATFSTLKWVKTAHEHENQSICGHVPRCGCQMMIFRTHPHGHRPHLSLLQ